MELFARCPGESSQVCALLLPCPRARRNAKLSAWCAVAIATCVNISGCFGERLLADPKSDESFKVIDRRLFNAEGEVREEALREERLKEETQLKAAAGAAASAKPPAGPSAAPDQAAAAAPLTAPTEAIKPSRGFQMLINFVGQNAAMLLGAYPDPRTGEPMLDLDGARDLIDMLDALREASRGNLAAEDDRLLVDVLGSLKLSFMEMTKAAAKVSQDRVKARP